MVMAAATRNPTMLGTETRADMGATLEKEVTALFETAAVAAIAIVTTMAAIVPVAMVAVIVSARAVKGARAVTVKAAKEKVVQERIVLSLGLEGPARRV